MITDVQVRAEFTVEEYGHRVTYTFETDSEGCVELEFEQLMELTKFGSSSHPALPPRRADINLKLKRALFGIQGSSEVPS